MHIPVCSNMGNKCLFLQNEWLWSEQGFCVAPGHQTGRKKLLVNIVIVTFWPLDDAKSYTVGL